MKLHLIKTSVFMPGKLMIQEGDIFGRWTIIKEAPKAFTKNGTRKQRSFICRCECGKEKIVLVSSLTTGRSLSCGCLHSELLIKQNFKHGLLHDKYYALWANIKNRCYNEESEDFVYYGARGITMYGDWINDALAFVTYVKGLKNSDDKTLSIDRINTNGNYEPGNLRWATAELQSRNQRLKKCNKTGYMGVYFSKQAGKFLSTIRYNGVSHVIARENTALDAYKKREQFIQDHNIMGYPKQTW